MNGNEEDNWEEDERRSVKKKKKRKYRLKDYGAGGRLGLNSGWRRGLSCVVSVKQLVMSRKDRISEEI